MLRIEKETGLRPVINEWVDNLFGRDDDFFPGFGLLNKSTPAVNVFETPEAFHLEVCVPGMKREDFQVSIESNALEIKAELEEEKKEEGKLWTRREFNYRNFRRTFMLPENVKADKIHAKYVDGILKLTLPKIEVKIEKVKRIPIEDK